MKKILLVSALVSCVSVAQAAVIAVTVDINGTAYATADSTITGTATGTYDNVTGEFSFTGTYNSVSQYSNYSADAIWTGSGLSATQENTSCTHNSGIVNACNGLASFNVPPLPINSPYDIGLEQNTLDAGGNGILYSNYLVNEGQTSEANYQVTYTITGGPVPEVPVPAAAWLFGSALVGLSGLAKRKK